MSVFADAANVDKVAVRVCTHIKDEFMHLAVGALRGGWTGDVVLERH